MVKKSEIFEEFFFNELFQATERTLEKLSEEKSWKINSYKEGKVRKWKVYAVPDFRLSKINLLPRGTYKKLQIEVYNQTVSAQCEDNWPHLTFDFLNQKKIIINTFFNELKKVIKEDFGQ